jgi:hypothetical protein
MDTIMTIVWMILRIRIAMTVIRETILIVMTIPLVIAAVIHMVPMALPED